MSRVYWDTMLFSYLLEGHPEFAARTGELLDRSYTRGDTLFTSYLAIGELMAGAEKSPRLGTAQEMLKIIREMGFSFLPFDGGAVFPFSQLRSKERLKAPDAIHLACAASAGVDIFLTGDRQIFRLIVPGIHFITDFRLPVL